MIGNGLNAQGAEVAGGLNPWTGGVFDPSTTPPKVYADGVGVVLVSASAAATTSVDAQGAGIVRGSARATET